MTIRHVPWLPSGLLILGSISLLARPAAAQAAGAAHTPICEKGVRVYTDLKDVPSPYETLTVPPPKEPIRVTNPDEAAEADRQMKAAAGSVGATGMVFATVEERNGGMVMLRRNTTAVFVASDTARALAACRK